MIHVSYKLTKKEFKKYYIQAMSISYMKIYFVVLTLGIIIMGLLGFILSNQDLLSSSLTMATTFIPTLLLCLALSIFISWMDLRGVEKKHPELMEGDIKIRFEKRFIILQINKENNKLTYDPFKVYPGFKNAILLNHIEKQHIIIPASVLTKEQIKTIKENIRG